MGESEGSSGGTACGGISFYAIGAVLEFGMMRDGQNSNAPAASVGWIFVRGFPSERRYAAFSVIRIYGSSASTGAQKNSPRLLWEGPDGLV